MTNDKPEVDLDAIIKQINSVTKRRNNTEGYIGLSFSGSVKEAMREACRQILSIAAENGKAKKDTYKLLNGKRNVTYARVDKQSILDCIQYVK